MASQLSQIRDRVGKFWPLLIVLVVVIFCFAQFDVSMIDRISTYCDVRKVMQKPGREDASHGGGLATEKAEISPLPHSVAITLLHYATSHITPQQTHAEVSVTLNILNRRGPCNFLVYGLGHDSPMWQAFNYGGHTVFLEEDPKWIGQMQKAHPTLEAHHVVYSTMLSQADDLLVYTRNSKEVCSPRHDPLVSECKLAIKTLPPHVYDIEWDVIMIDAPRGYFAEAPGRMSAIYTSAVMAMARKRPRSTDILLHDVERHVENTWATEFLCKKNQLEAVGKLWHFQVYGEGSARSPQFCMA